MNILDSSLVTQSTTGSSTSTTGVTSIASPLTSSKSMIFSTTSEMTTDEITSESTTTFVTSTTMITTMASKTTTTSMYLVLLKWNNTGETVAGELNRTNATSIYLKSPFGIILDSSDSLYVSDSANHRVQKFLSGSNESITVAGDPNGTAGSSLNRFLYTYDCAVDSKSNLYVVDVYNHRVLLWKVNASSGIRIAGGGE